MLTVLSGKLAFRGVLDNCAAGLFAGPDPADDEIVAIGDALFNSTVTNLRVGQRSVNDAGQVAFWYVLADGRSGVALATPLPEPANAGLAAASAALLLRRRRRRGGSSRTEADSPV